MKSTSSIDIIWHNYQFGKDSNKITKKVIDKEKTEYYNDTELKGTAKELIKQDIDNNLEFLRDFTLVSFWAVFELELVDFIRQKYQVLKSEPPLDLYQRLHRKIDNEVEYWRGDDRIDILKGILDSNTVGLIKQFKEYRDWVVHRSNPPSAKVIPETAYPILSYILSIIKSGD